jgi:hypothetical protein
MPEYPNEDASQSRKGWQDMFQNGLEQSAGIMVNRLYSVEHIERSRAPGTPQRRAWRFGGKPMRADP